MKKLLLMVLLLAIPVSAHAQKYFADTSGPNPQLYQRDNNDATKPGNCPNCTEVTAAVFAGLQTQVRAAGKPKTITGRAFYNRLSQGEKSSAVVKPADLKWLLDVIANDNLDLTDPQLSADVDTHLNVPAPRKAALLTP